jgi:hypothetical protein
MKLKISRKIIESENAAWIMFSRFMVNVMLAMMGLVAQAVADSAPVNMAIVVLVLILVGLYTIGSILIDLQPIKPIQPKK